MGTFVGCRLPKEKLLPDRIPFGNVPASSTEVKYVSCEYLGDQKTGRSVVSSLNCEATLALLWLTRSE